MNVRDAVFARRSIRAFKPDPIDKETLRALLETATHAPSWANSQPWEVFVAGGEPLKRLREAYLAEYRRESARRPDITPPQGWPDAVKARISALMKQRQDALAADRVDPADLKRMSESNMRFFDAPAVVYICMDKSLSSWSLFDLGSLAQSLMLAAEERSLGTIPAVMLAAYPDLVRAELGVPDHLAIVIGIAIGHPDPDHPLNRIRTDRRPIDEVVTFKGM